jgi:hypothetical protein
LKGLTQLLLLHQSTPMALIFFLSTCLQRAFSSSNKFSVDFLHYGTVFSSFTTVLDVVVSYLAIDALETQMPFYDFHHH